MKGPHPKPGRNDLNRIREFQEKATQFENDLLEAGRTEKEAEREAVDLAHKYVRRLEETDPDNYGWRPRNWESEKRLDSCNLGKECELFMEVRGRRWHREGTCAPYKGRN